MLSWSALGDNGVSAIDNAVLTILSANTDWKQKLAAVIHLGQAAKNDPTDKSGQVTLSYVLTLASDEADYKAIAASARAIAAAAMAIDGYVDQTIDACTRNQILERLNLLSQGDPFPAVVSQANATLSVLRTQPLFSMQFWPVDAAHCNIMSDGTATLPQIAPADPSKVALVPFATADGGPPLEASSWKKSALVIAGTSVLAGGLVFLAFEAYKHFTKK